MAIPDLSRFLHALRLQESGGNYQAYNPSSGAAGAYQFLESTYLYALHLANLAHTKWANYAPDVSPKWVQDKAAGALVTHYYNEFGHSYYNVAEAWYGGPGAVGHPGRGGGPGYPTVGQYADQVMAKYRKLGGGYTAPSYAIHAVLTSYDRSLLGKLSAAEKLLDNIVSRYNRRLLWSAGTHPRYRVSEHN